MRTRKARLRRWSNGRRGRMREQSLLDLVAASARANHSLNKLSRSFRTQCRAFIRVVRQLSGDERYGRRFVVGARNWAGPRGSLWRDR